MPWKDPEAKLEYERNYRETHRQQIRDGHKKGNDPTRGRANHRKPWLADDDQRLRRLKGASAVEAAEALGRSTYAVEWRRHTLRGLGKDV